MDGVKFVLVMLYCLIGSTVLYILHNKDCRFSFYFLKVLVVLMMFEALVIFSYDDVCSAMQGIFCGQRSRSVA